MSKFSAIGVRGIAAISLILGGIGCGDRNRPREARLVPVTSAALKTQPGAAEAVTKDLQRIATH